MLVDVLPVPLRPCAAPAMPRVAEGDAFIVAFHAPADAARYALAAQADLMVGGRTRGGRGRQWGQGRGARGRVEPGGEEYGVPVGGVLR